MKKRENDPKEQQALARFAAVSFIKQQRKGGWPLSQCLKAAAERPWLDRNYAISTLEEWFYLYAQGGFEALKPKGRKDRGEVRSLTPEVCSRLERLRREHPKLTVRSLVRQLLKEGALKPGEFSLSSIYRSLNARGLDARSLRAQEHLGEGAGPQKAFESPFANDLWMTDIMHGPTLAAADGKRPVGTRLFALIDDCSRLVTGAIYYPSESLDCLLDTFRHAIKRRGIPLKLYSDNGKVFTCRHLKVVCANLDIQLLHARPYHSWSKGKIERFFRTVQTDFQQRLPFDPVSNIEELNRRFHIWLEKDYHQSLHSSLEGQSPIERFRQRSAHLRTAGEDLERYFLNETTRRVRRDATFSLDGRLYEVSPSLRGHKIEVRYDPFTHQRIDVYVRGNYCQQARPLNKNLNFKSSNNYESIN
jgi:putative transposase